LCGPAIASNAVDTDNRERMSIRDWQRRIDRAEELAGRYEFAAEILRFYSAIARFQQKFYGEIEEASFERGAALGWDPFAAGLGRELGRRFRSFIPVVEKSGPGALRKAAHEMAARSEGSHFELLTVFWEGYGALNAGPDDFFARAFLQPYAAAVRVRSKVQWKGPTAYICPFCKRKPVLGTMRPLGDGGQRSLLCSFCLGEWEFRRILCPGCGEENPAKLPVYEAEELRHVRVEACDSCKMYIKTVDLTKSGVGDPMVDEIASVPLDLWARDKGYTKLQWNLLQL
jgi:FdhE protein